jgi:hypothetical protein
VACGDGYSGAEAARASLSHAVFKDVGPALLEYGCQARTGSRDDDGCWPNWGL